jgi:acyl-CoA hydrolase
VENYTLVRQEHLNHYGFLFGGMTLKWVDEFAWVSATLDHPDCNFVTRAMDNIEFKENVPNGSIMRFSTKQNRLGRTSVTYLVEVFARAPGDKKEGRVFVTHITFVNVDPAGNAKPLV